VHALLTPAEALEYFRHWATVESLGRAETPLCVVDLRGLDRSFRKDDQDGELAGLLTTSAWINVAVVDDDLDPDFAVLADSFDVLIGDGTHSRAAVDTTDVAATLVELQSAVTASPIASVELARLLRVSHALPIAQALHLESLTYAVLQTGETYQQWLAARRQNQTAATERQARAVEMELTGSLLRVNLNRPDKRNALNVTMRDQLVEALELADADQAIDGVLLTGAGDNFCAGGDLDEFGTTPSAAMGHHVRMVRSVGALMHRVRSRMRVHVHGACVGAGIELPAFTPAIIAHPNATFRLPEIGFGLVPGAGGTVSVTRRCGRHRTAWLALTGATINAEHALRWELIDRIDESVFV